jgi:predicted O-methyltransferase YrrM
VSALRSLLSLSIQSILPTRPFPGLPEVELPHGIRDGRVPRDGYRRGVGLDMLGVEQQLIRDPDFRRAFKEARRNGSVVTRARLMNLYLIIRYFMPVGSKNIIEFGSYRGGSAIFMALLLKRFHPAARLYALDTFAGMPKTDSARDLHRRGDFNEADIDAIRRRADALGLDNLHLVKGLVEDTAERTYAEAGPFGLAHLDLDIYAPLKFAHETVVHAMTPGGFIIYDDATTSTCLGATEAVEDMIRAHHLRCEQIYPHFVFRAGL